MGYAERRVRYDWDTLHGGSVMTRVTPKAAPQTKREIGEISRELTHQSIRAVQYNPNAGLRLGHRLRHWPSIILAFGERLVLNSI